MNAADTETGVQRRHTKSISRDNGDSMRNALG